MHEPAYGDHGDEYHERNNERAEGLNEQGLHALMILDASLK
jgi:hypothetical protein